MNCFVKAQEDLKARLLAQAYFADIPIVTEAKGTITEDVAQAIASSGLAENPNGKYGVAIVLRTPEFSVSDPERAGLALVLLPKISVYENVVVNQSAGGIGKPALDVVHAVLFLVHGYAQQRGPRHSVTGGDSEEREGGLIAYHVDVSVTGAINGMPT